jgi:signal transduction histidine kinase
MPVQHRCWLGTLTIAAALSGAAFAADDATALRSIGEILSLPAALLAGNPPARVRGTVTMGPGNVVIQDGSDAIYIQFAPRIRALAQALELGDVLEAEGVARPGQYAPGLVVERFTVLSRGPLPEPAPADMGRLFAGKDSGQRIVITGIVQEVLERERQDSWQVVIASAARRLVAILPRPWFPDRPDALIDAEVRVAGVVGAFRNDRGEFVAPVILVAQTDDLEVVQPPPASPFAADVLPLDAIARFRRDPVSGHRVLTEGVVSFVLPRSLWLARGEAGVRVDLVSGTNSETLRPGDRVQVAGFLDMSRRIAGLTGAVVRKVGVEAPPLPFEVRPAEIGAAPGSVSSPLPMPRGSHDGRLVRCVARLVDVQETPERVVLALTDDRTTLTAVLPASAAALAGRLQPGSEVAVTGIVQLDATEPGRDPEFSLNIPIERISLLLRGADDVTVVRAPPWWTPRRLATLLGVAAGVLGGTLLWIVLLRRQVRTQSRQLAAEIRSRRDSALEFEATLRERNRLAANLHDTLLQTLGGIGYQLDACEGSRSRDESEARIHFDVARRMVHHASTELHKSVWAMRSLPIREGSFPDAIRALVDRVGEGHATRIQVHTEGNLDDVPEFVAGNVMLIAQEAVVNALRHGQPDTISVLVADRPPLRLIEVVVKDDGRGFDPHGRQGFAEGHFGLEGMRERAERLGGTLEIDSHPGRGTTVRATVRRHEIDADVAAERAAP